MKMSKKGRTMPSEGYSQIVITRKGQDVFKVTTFDRTDVVGSEFLDGKSMMKLLETEIDRLEVITGAL